MKVVGILIVRSSNGAQRVRKVSGTFLGRRQPNPVAINPLLRGADIKSEPCAHARWEFPAGNGFWRYSESCVECDNPH